LLQKRDLNHPLIINLNSVWAKSSLKEKETSGESLTEHTYRVLVSLREVLKKYPVSDLSFKEWLFWAAALHDLGKIAEGFQARLRGDNTLWGHRHEVLSLAFLDWVIPKKELVARKWIVATILSHHKESDLIDKRYPVRSSSYTSKNQIRQLVEELDIQGVKLLQQWMTEIVPRWKEELGFGPLLWEGYPIKSLDLSAFYSSARDSIYEGLTLYDQLTYSLSSRKKNPDDIQMGIILRGAILLSDHRASAGVFQFKEQDISLRSLLNVLGIKEKDLYKHQKKVLGQENSTILIAPTGSGKTETALLWAYQHNSRNPMIYLLPYQASMNAMYERLQRYFPSKVGLQHSKVVQAYYRRLMEQEFDPKQSVVIAKRLKSLNRLDQYPVRVTSPYQILKAMFRVKGYEALLFQLQNSSIVVDEIHAYDVKRTAMLIKMFGYLQKVWNVKHLFMSATFPKVLLEALGQEIKIDHIVKADEEFYALARRHRVFIKGGNILEIEGLQLILDRIRKGENVLVVCNTVQRAQYMWKSIEESNIPCQLLLLHGRLHGRDRQKVENLIMKRMSKGNERDSNPTVLVATQAVEVSLDVSFDVGFTDPAPLEALLQRFGRVNRKPFPPIDVKDVFIFAQPTSFQGIYEEEAIKRALDLLSNQGNGFIIDESQISNWLDQIYTGELLKKWKSEYQHYSRTFESILQGLVPFMADPEISEEFYQQFDSVPVLAYNLLEEYLELQESSPIAAEELLVNIRWYSYCKIKMDSPKDLDFIKMVKAHYIPEFGLQIN
jgi:CRISPR-associated endonuclease/helicase Cas3